MYVDENSTKKRNLKSNLPISNCKKTKIRKEQTTQTNSNLGKKLKTILNKWKHNKLQVKVFMRKLFPLFLLVSVNFILTFFSLQIGVLACLSNSQIDRSTFCKSFFDGKLQFTPQILLQQGRVSSRHTSLFQ